MVRRVPVRDANDLQTVPFHLLIAEHPASGCRNGMQIFTVIPKLLMVPSDEIHSLWRHEFVQWLRCSPRVDGCSVYKSPAIKIASGSSFKIFAPMRSRKLPFRTCPKCRSLINAALRPRHAAGT